MSWTRICDRRHRVLRRGRTLIVWLSGTIGHSEWARNFRIRTIPRYGRRVKAELWGDAVTVVEEIKPMLDGVEEIIVAGFSRGGGLAQVVTLALNESRVQPVVVCRLWAPKRALSEARDLPITHCSAYYGDIVPFLPPWYGRVETMWIGPFDWIWRAHNKAAHDAAWWRYYAAKGTKE